MVNKGLLLFLGSTCLSLSCSTLGKSNLASSDSYQTSKMAVMSQDYQMALAQYPTTEKEGFITRSEKGYLQLLAGAAAPDEMLPLAKTLEDKQTTYVSKELGQFFYKETAEGYFPSEHEAILYHLVLGYGFAQQGRRTEARVEANRAARYLQGHFSERTGDFDDAGIRIWLAGLWIYCGEWQHARVDLKVAARLNPALTWARDAANKKKPPENLHIILAGMGPEVFWKPQSDANPIKGLANVQFSAMDQTFDLKMTSSKTSDNSSFVALPTQSWYQRHQERNNAMRDVLGQSKYMLDATVVTSAATGTYIGSTTLSTAIVTAAIATGVGLFAGGIYLAIVTHTEELIYLGTGAGLAVGSYGVDLGGTVYKSGEEQSKKILKSGLDTASYYRYVRFLPDAILAGISEDPTSRPSLATSGNAKLKPFTVLKAADGNSTVSLYHLLVNMQGIEADLLSRVWIDENSNRQWIVVNRRATFDQARDACKLLTKIKNQSFKLADIGEIQDADEQGLTIMGANNQFAEVFNGSPKIWLINDMDGGCRSYDARSHKFQNLLECKGELLALCVSGQ